MPYKEVSVHEPLIESDAVPYHKLRYPTVVSSKYTVSYRKLCYPTVVM